MSNILRSLIGAENYYNTIGYLNRLYKSAFIPYYEKGINLVPAYIPEGGVCLDIGANIGRFTRVIARATGKKGKVYSFEPLKYPRKILKHMAFLRGLNQVEVESIALSDSPGRAFMKIPLKNGVKPQPALATLGELPDDEYIQEEVKIDTLDNFAIENNLTRLDFIKCDAEGFEYQVFKGGEAVLKKFKPSIFCEVTPHFYELKELDSSIFFEYLDSLGYSAYYPDESDHLVLVEDYSSLPSVSDYFFIHESKATS